MCKKNVQTGCTGYVHIAAMRMMENNECFTVLLCWRHTSLPQTHDQDPGDAVEGSWDM